MPESHPRRLTAILATDIAGYSRLVENDDEGTLAQWKAHWHALVEPNVKEFHGRIVRVIGDGAIVEFARLYASEFQLAPLNFSIEIALLAMSAGLGLIGALLSVKRHLGRIS